MTDSKLLRVLAALLILVLYLPADAKKGKGDGGKDEDETWDVSNPPGDWRTIAIDTEETTWTNLDVSPDGATIVFDMLGDLYTVPIEGGNATALTDGIEWNIQPRFSPDGNLIAFISDRAGGDNLWVMDADGSAPRAITSETEHLVHNPNWAPGGEYLVAKKGFTSTRSIPAGEIWMFHVGGGGGLNLIERPGGKNAQKNIAEPAFSSDGRYVYFSQDNTPGTTWQYNKDSTGRVFVIKRLNRETGRVEVLVDGAGGALRPTPSPDGTRLAFVKRTPDFTSAIYLKDLASGKEWALYDRLDRDLQEANGSQGNTPAFAWTPDGASIVFWAGGRIRRIDVASGETQVIPVRVRARKQVRDALRFAVDVAPDDLDVRMLRWSQYSPDGSKVVFQALGHLYIRAAGDGKPRRLTTQNEHYEFWPRFSPDGRSIVYVSWNDEQLGSVRTVPVTGGAGRVLTEARGHYVEPRFSNDGKQVVYRKITGGFLLSGNWSQEPGIYVMPADGGEVVRVSRSGFNPQFTPDGERVLFSDSVEQTQLALKSVNLAGHDERTHLQGATVREFSVSPDGAWVAFAQQFKAWVAPFPRTGKTVTIGPDTKAIPVRQVSDRAGEFLHWSADSGSLHWSHGPTLYSRELKDAFAFLDGAPDDLPEPVTDGLDLGFTVVADKPEGAIALVGARVVTMRDADAKEEIIEDGVVLVVGNRIEAVGVTGEVELPAGARTIDVAGKTIVPGFVDCHAHGAMARSEITPQQNWAQFSNLAFGVTTIHDPSNDTSSVFAAGELQRAGMAVGPRVFSTGTILYGAHAPGFHAAIASYEDAEFHVQRLKDAGAISVKSYQQPRRDQRQQVIEAAAKLEMMVVPEGGAKFQHNMNQIVDGHTGIEHAIPQVDAYDDVVQFWSQTTAGYTPTFGVAYGGLSGENYWYDRTDVWKNERLMRYSPRFVIEPRSMRRPTAPDEHYNHIHVATTAKKLRDAGVPVLIGAHGQREGLAAHWEMWMMEQGGFTPWEALRGATIDGAHYIGLDADVGSIEAGKLADLVVIEGNPLENLRRSEYIAYTMINGRLYEAATMNQIAPDEVTRGEFFFEHEGGDTIHPATWTWLENLQETFGWVH